MIQFMTKKAITYLFACLFLFASCASGGGDGKSSSSGKTEYPDRVVIHNLSDPDGLHPTNSTGASSTTIRNHMFQKLLSIDYTSLELQPWLAAKMPTVEEKDGGMIITYELKKGLEWDDGKPITARDVEFSIMCIKNPKVDAPHLRPYYGFIKDFVYDKDNPQKFQLICDEVFMLWDHSTGNDGYVFPEHLYDPNGYMKDFSLKDMIDENTAAVKSSKNIKFAQDFNDVNFHRTAINGSGPYKFVEWQTNQRVIMELKEDWYGDKFKGTGNQFFTTGPQKVIFETVNDMTTAITALKAEDLDVVQSVRPNDWVKLPDSDKFNENYIRSTPDFLTYSYIGIHTKNPLLRGKKTRQALAHLIDADVINETVLYGLNYRIVGPISKAYGDDYNNDLPLYQFDTEKAKQLLAADGWEDSDGDGILDKVIDGKRRPFKTTFYYNQGNAIRKSVGLTLQESARLVGIDIGVSSLEWSVFLERLKQHKIDLWYGAWVFDPRPSDPKQIWHTDSYTSGGSNYTGFGNAETNALIEAIRSELDPGKRKALYMKWQELLHEEVPYVFLFSGKRRNAIHKRFTNLKEGARNPGYYSGGFQMAKGFSATVN